MNASESQSSRDGKADNTCANNDGLDFEHGQLRAGYSSSARVDAKRGENPRGRSVNFARRGQRLGLPALAASVPNSRWASAYSNRFR